MRPCGDRRPRCRGRILASVLKLRAHPILAWVTFIDVAATGLSSLWAGIFPLPDPRHGGHPALLFAMLLLPFIMATTLWTLGASRPLKGYFAATIGLLLVMFPVMSGMTGLDTHAYRGLFQRIFALTVFPPIGVGAFVLASRILTRNYSDSAHDERRSGEQPERVGSVDAIPVPGRMH